MFTLAIVAFPSKSSESSSTTGAIILQGPHHGAQKSTIVTPSATVASKLSFVNSTYFAMFKSFKILFENYTIISLMKHGYNLSYLFSQPQKVN